MSEMLLGQRGDSNRTMVDSGDSSGETKVMKCVLWPLDSKQVAVTAYHARMGALDLIMGPLN